MIKAIPTSIIFHEGKVQKVFNGEANFDSRSSSGGSKN